MGVAPQRFNLSDELPKRAVDLYRDKPDPREDYTTISAKEAGYDNRNGDLAELIEEAARNGELVDLESGEYEIHSEIYRSSGLLGLIGNGSEDATVYYRGTSENYLFRPYCDEFVLDGVGFDISEPAGNGFDTDVGLVHSEIDEECWVDDIEFRGRRHYNQDLDGDGDLESVGGRMTFLIEMTSPSGAALINNARFPHGGTDEHVHVGTVGHAIGPNADPGHRGLNVWRNVTAANFVDNGFYVNNSPGGNLLWNCYARNNAAGNMRLGDNDLVIGGRSEVTSLPPGRQGKPLEANSGSNIEVVGLDIYGEGDAIGGGAQAIQIRSGVGDVTIRKTRAHIKDSHHLARFDDATVHLEDCWFYQENCRDPAVRIGARGSPAEVTATGLRLRSDGTDEIDGPITIDGRHYTGRTTAEDAGLEDPLPLPVFVFGDEGLPIQEPVEDWEQYYSPTRALRDGLRDVWMATDTRIE